VVPPPPLPADIVVAQLTDLLTIVHLEWLVLLRPKRLASTAWLAPSIARILEGERLDLLARATGIDLRNIPELALAGYGKDDSVAWLLRHQSDSRFIERKFRERLTSNEERTQLGHQLIGVSGNIGTSPHDFVSIGRDIVGYQYGGARKRGPARIALLYAQKQLRDIPTVLADPSLGHIDRALGLAPVKLLLPGPFLGAVGRGARGLLAGADGLGAALTPTDHQTLELMVLLAGDYGQGPQREEANRFLLAAWDDLVKADLGHLLGLHEPKSTPMTIASTLGLELRVELDAVNLFTGLAAATVDNVREIMR
jgi:hypothetical protein